MAALPRNLGLSALVMAVMLRDTREIQHVLQHFCVCCWCWHVSGVLL